MRRRPPAHTRARRRPLLALACALLWPSTALAEPLTADQALARATARSPELQAALAALEASRQAALSEARARDPVLTAGLQGSRGETFSDTAEGATLNSSEVIGGDVGVRWTTDVGTRLEAGLSTSSRWQTINRDPTTSASVTLGPTIAAELSLNATQPLLRGGGEDATLAALRIARSQLTQAELDEREAASKLALDVLSSYWDLWVAERSLEVERAGLELTRRQRADLDARLKLGSSTELDALRLASEEASRRQRVLSAEASLGDRQLALARLVGLPLAEATTLSATSTPSATPASAELSATLAAASAQSPELARLDAAIAQARERLRAASDAAQTRLDLWASVAAGGLWTEDPPAGLELPGGRPAFTAMVGLDLELPLGASSADADRAQAAANLRAAELRREARAETLGLEVARLHRSLAAARDSLASATETAALAARLADKEDARLKLGAALLTELISAQQTQREAELSRLRALADAEQLALSLDHLAGTLLSRLTSPTTETAP